MLKINEDVQLESLENEIKGKSTKSGGKVISTDLSQGLGEDVLEIEIMFKVEDHSYPKKYYVGFKKRGEYVIEYNDNSKYLGTDAKEAAKQILEMIANPISKVVAKEKYKGWDFYYVNYADNAIGGIGFKGNKRIGTDVTYGYAKRKDDKEHNFSQLKLMTNESKQGKSMKKSMSETYLSLFDAVPPIDDKENKISTEAPIQEQDENSTEFPKKLVTVLDRLSKKSNTVKVEMQDVLIKELLKEIQALPNAARVLKAFASNAALIVLKGEEIPPDEE